MANSNTNVQPGKGTHVPKGGSILPGGPKAILPPTGYR